MLFVTQPARPPGPKRKFPGSTFIRFRRDPLIFLQQIAREYGDIAYFTMGPQSVYFVNHPDIIKDILITNHSKFIKGRALQRAKRLLGEGLLTSEHEFHKRQRRLAQPAFHRQRIAYYGTVMTEYAARATERWTDRETIDIWQEMMRLTLAIVGKTLFDADVESEADEIGDALTEVMEMFGLLLMPFSELLEKLPLPQTRRFQKARDRLDATIYRLIDDRRKSGLDRGDLLSMLLLAQDEESSGERMTDEQVRDEAMTIFLAGHETTANAMTWTWYLLSKHPEVEAKLHEEVDRVLADKRLPATDDVPQLRYTEMVFTESMRLYPPAWAIGRLVHEEYEINGYYIPKRSLMLASQYVTHRDERFFPDPTRFDPQRWTPEARETRPAFSYFPFGGGTRRCIGEGFAWIEGILLLATIARRWKMREAPDNKVALYPVVTLRPRFGMRMELARRG